MFAQRHFQLQVTRFRNFYDDDDDDDDDNSMLLLMMMMMMMTTYTQVCPFYAHDADHSNPGPLHTSSRQGGKPQSDTPRFADVGKGYSPIKCVWRSLREAT